LLRGRAQSPVLHYVRNSWNPHATLALELPGSALPQAMDVLRTTALPFEGIVDRVGVIDTSAEIELETVWFAK
jgi:hypothetical protein